MNAGPKGDNFDESYLQKAVGYNTQRSQRYFTQQRAEWQVTRKALVHGMYTGLVYGGAVGLAASIYTRKLSMIPKYIVGVGAPYSAFLTISTVYRMDV